MTEFNYKGYGRTRRPKSVHPSGVDQAVTSNTDPSNDNANNGEQGYPTENQRYLHVLLDTTPSEENITMTVFGYYHASNRWAPMYDVRGSIMQFSSGPGGNAQCRIFEINGVDRVYFKTDAELDEADFFYAALSTF